MKKQKLNSLLQYLLKVDISKDPISGAASERPLHATAQQRAGQLLLGVTICKKRQI